MKLDKLDLFFKETRFKCMYCGKTIINNRWANRFEGLSEEGICLRCLKDKLASIKGGRRKCLKQ